MSRHYEGDIKLYLTPNGSDIQYEGGQPVMERGLDNQALISLFTKEGWCGNTFLPKENRIGSDFEKTCSGSITLSKLVDIEDSAVRSLSGKSFTAVKAIALNSRSDALKVQIQAEGISDVLLTKEGGVWK